MTINKPILISKDNKTNKRKTIDKLTQSAVKITKIIALSFKFNELKDNAGKRKKILSKKL